jgi:Tfp pilus assembly protein PilZ
MNIFGRRRTERILAPVRIRVIGNDAAGISFAEDTVTVSFNQQGARISLTHSLLPDDIVVLKNLETGVEGEFRVVGAFQQVFGSRREWGIEAVNPESSIWGVEFTAAADAVEPKVMMECAACKTAAQNTVSGIEYDVLLATGLVSRHCDRCNETTRWKPSQLAGSSGPVGRSVKSSTPEGTSDQRRTRRLKLIMELRIRNDRGVVDLALTRDVSKTGLCMVTTQRFSMGDELYVTLPHSQSQAAVETRAKVVWTAEGTAGRFYGIEYLR